MRRSLLAAVRNHRTYIDHMKSTHASYSLPSAAISFASRDGILPLLMFLLALGPAHRLGAADVIWTGGTSHGASPAYWTNAANWNPGVPTNIDNAVLASTAGGSTNAYIEFAATPVVAGSITLSSDLTDHNLILRSQSATAVLALYGNNGLLMTNASSKQLQVMSSGGTLLTVRLAGSGAIGGVGPNLWYSPIGETNGSYGFTKTGPNLVTFSSTLPSTYSGGTTIAEGSIRLGATSATLGSGPINFAGGDLINGLDRGGVRPLSNSVVVSANSRICSDSGTASSTRNIVFSGAFSGNSGTLSLQNIGTVGNITNMVRLIGGFSFSRDVVLGLPSEVAVYRYSILALSNSASGPQTFSGTISGPGSVQREVSAGTTTFAGANTYEGGTTISGGTLLASNTTGSALGSGPVTVSGVGVLGGNGSIVVSPNTVTVTTGGTVSPGTSSTNIANLSIDSLTLSSGANYLWQIAAATGTAGVNWDLITVSSWTDGASSANPITIKVDSRGVTPTGWSPGTARDWVILQSSSTPGYYSAGDFTLDTTAFSGSVAGIFGLSVDTGGSLHLTYTPAADIVINVASGTKTQTEASYAILTGAQGVVKIGNGELVLDNPLNDYLGSTKVLAGTLSLSVDAANGSPGALGNSSTATYLGNTTGNSNATLNINVAGVAMSHSIVVQSGSSGVKTIGTTLTSGAANYFGDIALQDSAVLSAAAGSSILFSGDFSGNGGLTLNGPGAFNMGGPGTGTYAGPTTVNTPVLNFNGPAFGTNTVTFVNAIALDNTTIPTAGLTLNNCPQNWNGNLEFIGSADLNLGSGPVTISSNRSLTIDNGNFVVGGPIAGNGGLTKLGAGTLRLLAATPSTYTGGTTNLGGYIWINGTDTFGDGTGTLLLGGGNLCCSESRAASPLANPVLMTADTILICTNRTGPTYLTFSGPFNVTSGALALGNKGWNTTISGLRLQGTYSLTGPITVGGSPYDNASYTMTNQLDFYNDTNTPLQIVSGLIDGPPASQIRRGANLANAGGATVFTAQNTYQGGTYLTSGAIGFGTNSDSSSGTLTAGPIGTGLLTIGSQSSVETNLGLFAYGGPRVVDNPILLNGPKNVRVTGTNNLTFTGPIDAGGTAKTWTVVDTGVATLSGQITASASPWAPLTKAGNGTLVLSGDNLYGGTTTVSAGKLLVNNTTGSGTGTNTVSVQSGATLGGTGTIAGRVTATSGNIAPGQSAGTLTVGGGVNLSGGGTYLWELAANSTNGPGSNFDVLAVTGGSVVLGGTAQIAISFIGSATAPDAANPFWQTNHSWTILTVGDPATNPGPTAFPSIVNGTYSAGSFTNYADVSGNIILAFTPGAAPLPPRPVISGTITGAGTANRTLSWSAVSGIHYQLQYKTNLNQANWLVAGDVTATGSTASLTHTDSLRPQCFYRVIVP